MPIPIRERFFASNTLEDMRRNRTDALLALIESMEGYTELDRLLFEPVVEDLVICELHIRDLDRRIVCDPDQWASLNQVRSSTATRLAKLRSTLLSKIKQCSVSEEAPMGLMEALA
jgi:hypothetical protein